MAALGDWLTTQEAAELAGYHPNHIRRLLKQGEVQAHKFGPTWMISRESLLQYLERIKNIGERRGPKPEK